MFRFAIAPHRVARYGGRQRYGRGKLRFECLSFFLVACHSVFFRATSFFTPRSKTFFHVVCDFFRKFLQREPTVVAIVARGMLEWYNKKMITRETGLIHFRKGRAKGPFKGSLKARINHVPRVCPLPLAPLNGHHRGMVQGVRSEDMLCAYSPCQK